MKCASAVFPDVFRRAWRRIAGGPGSLRSQLVQGAVGSGGISITKRLVLLATAVLFVRILGADGYGVYAYASSLVMILSVPAHFGLPNLIVREVAVDLASREWGRIRGLLQRANQASLLFSTLVAAIGAVFGWLLSERIEVLEWGTFAWALALVPLGAFTAVRSATLRGLHHVVKGQLPEGLIRPLALLFLAAGAFSVSDSMEPHHMMILAVAAAGIGLLAVTGLLWRFLPAVFRNTTPQYETRKWLSSVWPFSLMAGIQVINSHTDIVMLGFFTTSGEVGIYQITSLGAALVALPLVTVNAVIAPKIASLHAANDQFRLQRLMTASVRLMLLVALPIAGCFIFLGKPILVTVFDHPFGAGAMPLAILSLAQIINVGTGSVGLYLNMTGYEDQTATILGSAAIGNILLNLLLIPPLGMTGAALATGITLVFWNICLATLVARRLGVKVGV